MTKSRCFVVRYGCRDGSSERYDGIDESNDGRVLPHPEVYLCRAKQELGVVACS